MTPAQMDEIEPKLVELFKGRRLETQVKRLVIPFATGDLVQVADFLDRGKIIRTKLANGNYEWSAA